MLLNAHRFFAVLRLCFSEPFAAIPLPFSAFLVLAFAAQIVTIALLGLSAPIRCQANPFFSFAIRCYSKNVYSLP